MFYKVAFWIYFVVASVLFTLWMLLRGEADFLQIVLMSFAAGAAIAFAVNAAIKLFVHLFQWMLDIDDYRKKHEARKDL